MRTILNKRNEINEGLLSRGADMVYAIRFLKLLVTPFKKTEAFKQGLVDENGYRTEIPIETNDQRSAFTIFHRLVFNVKKLMAKVPFGKTRLASYAAALFLVKEHTGISSERLKSILIESGETDLDTINESAWFENNNKLNKGTYTLVNDIASPDTAEFIARKNTKVIVTEATKPADTLFDINIYKVKHLNTKQFVYITNMDIKR
tara:strand:- start:581 stop:1195 length:615 start_codon:yes stop_codon:yes gene_type:complete